jgi:hypothetical protein
MWRLTRAWPSLLVVLVLASGCGGGSPTSPSTPSSGWYVPDCEIRTLGAMTATLDGTPWIPVSTRATLAGSSISLGASDCTYKLWIEIRRFRGPGTYDVAAGDVNVDHRCDGPFCGGWWAGVVATAPPTTAIVGGGSVTVTAYTPPTPGVYGSGAIEGTFAFTLVPMQATPPGATSTRVMTNGRFGSNFW